MPQKILMLAACLLVSAGAYAFEGPNPTEYVLAKFDSYDVVFLGSRHKRPEILEFMSGLIRSACDSGITHLALEICSDQQTAIDRYLDTGNGLDEIDLHPQIECAGYRNLFKTLRDNDRSARPDVVAIDLAYSLYNTEITRDEWMSRSIEKILSEKPMSKILVFAGNLHVLNKIAWEDHVPNRGGFIRSYLNPEIRSFSIVQLSGYAPKTCDFTKNFGNGATPVALDCDPEFNGWAIGVLGPVASKPMNVCDVTDGVIVY